MSTKKKVSYYDSTITKKIITMHAFQFFKYKSLHPGTDPSWIKAKNIHKLELHSRFTIKTNSLSQKYIC